MRATGRCRSPHGAGDRDRILGPEMSGDFRDNDPLWRMRHALAGVALALLLSVLAAALGGRVLGDAFGNSYGLRVTIYLVLLAYVVAGAAVLFVKVARHESRSLSPGRVVTWFASLWLWPLLLLAGRRRPPA